MLHSDGEKQEPELLYSFIADVPAVMASAFVRNPDFDILFLFPFTGAPSKEYSHLFPRFLVLSSPMISSSLSLLRRRNEILGIKNTPIAKTGAG